MTQNHETHSQPESRSFVLRVQAPRGWHDKMRRVRLEDVARDESIHFNSLADAFLAISRTLTELEASSVPPAKPH